MFITKKSAREQAKRREESCNHHIWHFALHSLCSGNRHAWKSGKFSPPADTDKFRGLLITSPIRARDGKQSHSRLHHVSAKFTKGEHVHTLASTFFFETRSFLEIFDKLNETSVI